MNAVNPAQSSIAPGDHAPAAEPSMEEILASIRRIIADDQSFPGRPGTELAASAEVAHEPLPITHEPDATSSPAELAEEHEATHVAYEAAPEAVAPHEVQAAPEAEASNAAPPEHAVHAPQFPSPEGLEMSSIMPEVAGVGSVAAELEAALAQTIPPEPAPGEAHVDPRAAVEPAAPAANLFSPAIDSSMTTAFNTLAASRLVASSDELMALVREMIRPLLKAWIDDHLPQVVERLVIAEIERIARGGT